MDTRKLSKEQWAALVERAMLSNFSTYNEATLIGEVAMVKGYDLLTNRPCYLVGVTEDRGNGAVAFHPVAVMVENNPKDRFLITGGVKKCKDITATFSDVARAGLLTGAISLN